MCIKRIKYNVKYLFTVIYENKACLNHSVFNIFDTD